MKERIQFLNDDADIRRVLTNEAQANGTPVLKTILGEQRYTELLALDASPVVLEIRAIATGMDAALSFKPKYDFEVKREDWIRFSAGWVGKPYTNKHSASWDDTEHPETLGRILKEELRSDGWYTYVYVMPSQDGYRKDVRAEALVFSGQMVRPVSSEFYVERVSDVITVIEPVLLGEVFVPNVRGSGVTGVFNKRDGSPAQQSMEDGMEKKEILMAINSLTPDELRGTAVFQLFERDVLTGAVKNADVRKAVLGELSAAEREALVNGLSKEVVAASEKLLTVAETILNERTTEKSRAIAAFVKTVTEVFKNEAQEELTEDEARVFMAVNSWDEKTSVEAVKKYVTTYKNMAAGAQTFFRSLLENQKRGVATPGDPEHGNQGVPAGAGGQHEERPRGFGAFLFGSLKK